MTSLRKWLAVAALAGLTACGRHYEEKYATPQQYSIKTVPADQVFEDHDGYRVRWTDENKEWKERKAYSPWRVYSQTCPDLPLPQIPERSTFKGLTDDASLDEKIRVFSDLPPGARGYARIVTYTMEKTAHCAFGDMGGGNTTAEYVEIRMPEGQKVSPGNETFGGKHAVHAPMREVQ